MTVIVCDLVYLNAVEYDMNNSLTTIGYLLGVFFTIWIPFLLQISNSAWS